jgi:GT2 family glycosyltransferase
VNRNFIVAHSVIIASKGRPGVLQETLESLARQDLPPGEIIVSVTCQHDVATPAGFGSHKLLFGPAGSSTQRNTGIRALDPKCELVTFLDDDVELAPDYFRQLRRLVVENPDAVGFGGKVLLNGTTRLVAKQTIREMAGNSGGVAQAVSGLYGCNMSFRRSAMLDEGFDERLSLYAWLEDFDFSSRMARKGRLLIGPDMILCHLAAPSGRMSHARFGFAQIMNPFYLAKKGIMTWPECLKKHLIAAILGNLAHLAKDPKSRSQRLLGNFKALRMIARGTIKPEAVMDLK